MDRDIDAEEDDIPKADADSKLKTIAHYAKLAFAPVVSVIALVFAVIAVTNNQSQSDRAQLSELTSKIDSLNASRSDTKGELDNLKFAMAREKTMHGDERRKMDERDAKIIQNVTHLQAKLKVSPTLEEQLREAASAPAVTLPVVIAASAPSLAPTSAAPDNKQVVAAPAPKITDKKPAAAAPATSGTEKTPVQVKVLKNAIEQFNKK